MKNKKAYYFTIDAMIALLIIFAVLFSIKILPKEIHSDLQVQEDLINVMSSIKMYEINNAYVDSLRTEGKISENKTLLEQIAEFYAKSMPEAETLTSNILSELNPEANIGIWFDNELIASSNSSPYQNAKEIWTSKQIVSGLEKGNVTGYSSRVYLKKLNQVKYYYFGGYIGDGNISIDFDYTGNLTNIDLEIAINSDFDIYINNQFSGHYENSTSVFSPASYPLDSYIDRFSPGTNTIEFVGDNLYIAGGYLKIGYIGELFYNESKKDYLPGIEGLINIYDGVTFPQNINSMEISLHMNSSYNVFMNLGNKTVYNGSTIGEEIIDITNQDILNILDYSDLEGKTVPFRLGLENVSYMTEGVGTGDVFSVTDLSGSMDDDLTCTGGDEGCCEDCWWIWCWDACDSDPDRCESCGGVASGKIVSAKEANNAFIDALLNVSGNQVGLVGYRSSVSSSDGHDLSTDNESLKSKVDEWYANGGTCICCGINEASIKLSLEPENRTKAMVVMSDGQANYDCPEDQGTGSASQDAIEAACDAYENYNITVYAVGFGADADNTTLEAIANCGNGEYYFSSVEDIIQIYEDIADDIIEASFKEQTIEAVGEVFTKLYSDSYILFNYTNENPAYGLEVSAESDAFNSSSQTSFYIPENSTPLEAFVLSYSGPRWTKIVNFYNNSWENIFNLSSYGSDYIEFGDPFMVKLSQDKLKTGTNLIELKIGTSPENSSSGSLSNKVIYTILKNILVYSPIMASSEGCEWVVEFYDSSNTTIHVPSNYSGTQTCSYTSDLISYNTNDAIDYSVHELLKNLDLDLDGRVDSKFTEDSLEITPNQIEDIPYTYKSEIQVRVWK